MQFYVCAWYKSETVYTQEACDVVRKGGLWDFIVVIADPK